MPRLTIAALQPAMITECIRALGKPRQTALRAENCMEERIISRTLEYAFFDTLFSKMTNDTRYHEYLPPSFSLSFFCLFLSLCWSTSGRGDSHDVNLSRAFYVLWRL